MFKSNHHNSKFTILGLFSLEPRLHAPKSNLKPDRSEGGLVKWVDDGSSFPTHWYSKMD